MKVDQSVIQWVEKNDQVPSFPLSFCAHITIGRKSGTYLKLSPQVMAEMGQPKSVRVGLGTSGKGMRIYLTGGVNGYTFSKGPNVTPSATITKAARMVDPEQGIPEGYYPVYQDGLLFWFNLDERRDK